MSNTGDMPPWSPCRDTLCLTPNHFTNEWRLRAELGSVAFSLLSYARLGLLFLVHKLFFYPWISVCPFRTTTQSVRYSFLPAVTTTTVKQKGHPDSHHARDTWTTPSDSEKKMLFLGALLLEKQDGFLAPRSRRHACYAQA